MERPYVPFYKPYGMTDEEYSYEVRKAEQRLDEWEAQMEEAKKEAEEVCFTCKKPMDATEHNYGTEDMLCCIHCYQLAQEQE